MADERNTEAYIKVVGNGNFTKYLSPGWRSNKKKMYKNTHVNTRCYGCATQ